MKRSNPLTSATLFSSFLCYFFHFLNVGEPQCSYLNFLFSPFILRFFGVTNPLENVIKCTLWGGLVVYNSRIIWTSWSSWWLPVGSYPSGRTPFHGFNYHLGAWWRSNPLQLAGLPHPSLSRPIYPASWCTPSLGYQTGTSHSNSIFALINHLLSSYPSSYGFHFGESHHHPINCSSYKEIKASTQITTSKTVFVEWLSEQMNGRTD